MSLLHEYTLPRDVAALWQKRGGALPPLQLQESADDSARSTLDAITSDVVLLHSKDIAVPAMVSAVRGILYLWNGWLDECAAVAEQAPDAEQSYLSGLIARQRGDTEAAKHAFQNVEAHEIFGKLAAETQRIIGAATEPALVRFKSTLQQADTWEPFAFINLFEQCRRCVLSASVERVARGIQCREVELLLVHCLETALGDRLPRVITKSDDAAARREQRERKMTGQTRRINRGASPARSTTATVAKPPDLKIKCPKCSAALQVPIDQRGKKTSCTKCKVAFLVPDGSLSNGMRQAVAAQPTIGVRCPKCQTLAKLNPSARGKAHTCALCAAQFLVPR